VARASIRIQMRWSLHSDASEFTYPEDACKRGGVAASRLPAFPGAWTGRWKSLDRNCQQLHMHRPRGDDMRSGSSSLCSNNQSTSFRAVQGEERMICHFYRENWPCKVMDKHMGILAKKHIETRFCKVRRVACLPRLHATLPGNRERGQRKIVRTTGLLHASNTEHFNAGHVGQPCHGVAACVKHRAFQRRAHGATPVCMACMHRRMLAPCCLRHACVFADQRREEPVPC